MSALAAVARTGNRDYADGQALATVVDQSSRHHIWRSGAETSACKAGRVGPIGLTAAVKGVVVSDLRPAVILYTPDKSLAHDDSKPRSNLVWSIDGGTLTVRLLPTALAPS